MDLIAIRAHSRSVAIGRGAARALMRELVAFPKPGLVSRIDNGSHADMEAAHFARSAFELRKHFSRAALLGAQRADFAALRRWGVAAEVAMGRATGGVNTHRGAIFALGLLSAAAGAKPAQTLGHYVRHRWGVDIAAHRRDPASHGSGATRIAGVGGAQAEAAAGFPSVYNVALPAYRRALEAGRSHEDAAVETFFTLLAEVEDTNLLHRGGKEGLRFARRAARQYLDGSTQALSVHRQFVAHGLSPGGSADLLAATLFVFAHDPHA